jgi:hypothetical protein
MALIGTHKVYQIVEHETETNDITISYPSDLEPSHPDYDKRGTEEVLTVPVLNTELVATHSNRYLFIVGASLQKISVIEDIEGNKIAPIELNFTYRIYASKEDRFADEENNYENALFSDSTSCPFNPETDIEGNLFSHIYSYLKTLDSFNEMVND